MRRSLSLPWHVYGTSVVGATHLRMGAANQDAIDWVASYGGEQPLVAVVLADGHGGTRYVRSALGAQFAVQVGRSLLHELGMAFYRSGDLAAAKRMAEHHLPALLVRGWQQRVDDHLADRPLAAAETAALSAEARASLDQNPRLAYGSTVVATLATTQFLFYLQLGDGDILAVDERGQACRAPVPSDPNSFADVTTSLCMGEAWRTVRSYFQPLVDHPPALILLATDGYANSFVTEADFLLAAEDIHTLMGEQPESGLRRLREQLPAWLRATSDQGSGDDITVGLLYRIP